MSFRTKLAGTLVGNGPSVSDGVTEQLLDELPFDEPVEVIVPVLVVVVGSTSVLEQAPTSGAMAAMPSRLPKPRFKNSLRSMLLRL